jgi:hypothetical protein
MLVRLQSRAPYKQKPRSGLHCEASCFLWPIAAPLRLHRYALAYATFSQHTADCSSAIVERHIAPQPCILDSLLKSGCNPVVVAPFYWSSRRVTFDVTMSLGM